MNYFFLMMLISLTVFAQERIKKTPTPDLAVKEIIGMDFKNGTAIISFKNMPMSMKIPENDKVMPCLKNAWKSHQKVLLEMDENQEAILGCKLYAGGNLDMGTPQGTPKAKKQAQESR